uniref:FHA domain-containing protein n=1 Tax=viral metagenome TaxID=1070528 RepID=A0A6C0JVB6_9ZZZZ
MKIMNETTSNINVFSTVLHPGIQKDFIFDDGTMVLQIYNEDATKLFFEQRIPSDGEVYISDKGVFFNGILLNKFNETMFEKCAKRTLYFIIFLIILVIMLYLLTKVSFKK